VARALQAIARDGRRGFYGGEFGERLIASGGGEYTEADLVRPQADWVAPLGVVAFHRRLWSPPPSSQGYQLLRGAALASDLTLPGPEDPDWAHLLIGCLREACADREASWHEAADGPALVAPEVIAAMGARIAGGSRPQAPRPVTGGTVSLCVIDRDRMAVSMLQSNFMEWGARRFLPGIGVTLHNRGACFSLADGHPAQYGPRRRPPHTLTPVLVSDPDGATAATVATRGGHIQPQVLLQLLARLYRAEQSPAAAMAAGRWADAAPNVLLEGQVAPEWAEGLAARGHRVVRRPPFDDEFGHAQLIVAEAEHLAAASDPRSPTWGVAVR
jgi:gamma-glutamyltranspeptidase/glutathione hydrolase